MQNTQLNLRIRYAERRRQGIYKNSKRVIWKTPSQHIA